MRARMRRDQEDRRRSLACALFAFMMLLSVVARPSAGAGDDEQRARTAVRLFRSLLAADLGIDGKTRGDGSLLVLFYGAEGPHAKELTELFAGDAGGSADVHGHPLAVETTADPTFANYRDALPAGIFLIADPGVDALKKIVQYGIDHRVIVYSPFEGHVERGVLAGLSIEAQVRPYLNTTTLEASDISLKSFFLKVTKLYP